MTQKSKLSSMHTPFWDYEKEEMIRATCNPAGEFNGRANQISFGIGFSERNDLPM